MRVLLNNINNVIYIQTRNSRRSLIEYRKRRAILKDYNIIESSKDQNVLEKLVQPLDKIVPINETKTSLTVDVLDSETLPLISEWRKNHLIRRARRILPLPISLTTDDKLGFVWKQTYIRSLAKKTSEPGKQLLDEIPEFLRLMFENDPDRFRSNFPDLYAKFIQLNGNVSKSLKTSVDESQSNREVYFPFHENLKQNIDSQFNNASQLLSIDDRDYQNYLNHNKFLEYLSSNLNSFPIAEYRPEIKNFASQIWLRNYGSSDPSIPSSRVPCSGCGAHLHCTSTNIPGFIPVEKFKLFNEAELSSQICQRCEFLRKFNVSLNVNVDDEEYPKIISKICSKKALIILLIDLLDFPCSLWPGITNLIGEKHRIYIVGNKIDLLPKDDRFYLERIKKSLKETLRLYINRAAKIRDVSLISAKTGYGIDNLVTKLLRDIKNEDIFLIGCTNSGKSTLFNALMQSDICALNDSDLMNRATISIWPGTTINLLKFPLRKMKGWEMQLRLEKMNLLEKPDIAENVLIKNLKRSKTPFAKLNERLTTEISSKSPFLMDNDHPLRHMVQNAKPFQQREKEYRNYLNDTPGVIYKDQLLNLLTTEELLRTIPREMITPRTYSLRPQQTLFLGGLARIDLMNARQHVWITVFASSYLPVNIVYTEMAKKFYEFHLGTDFLGVPLGDHERLKSWPNLCPKEITLDCIGWEESCADIVLSSAGWISITGGQETKCIMKVFTVDGRGIHIRNSPMLPFASKLRGKRIVGTPCFENKLYTIDDLKIHRKDDANESNKHQDEDGRENEKPRRLNRTGLINENRLRNVAQYIR
ncbi:50S ribosome-binding GTPase-like protein 1 [Sarcoptes scabiei]|uniref:50S ribosome-binding GTPase-like protein 1 n=1 Tax=Sarcoptes scabiei TaxID=52283 RepID=A0A131ZWK3_SARSC|nr:50S ribosome-binding GTPase-like protein 1 [Sarcoptes scabiei]